MIIFERDRVKKVGGFSKVTNIKNGAKWPLRVYYKCPAPAPLQHHEKDIARSKTLSTSSFSQLSRTIGSSNINRNATRQIDSYTLS